MLDASGRVVTLGTCMYVGTGTKREVNGLFLARCDVTSFSWGACIVG